MAQTLQLKRSAVPGKAPGVADLALGELAINTHDGKLYLKKDAGVPAIVEVGAGQEWVAGRFDYGLVSVAADLNADYGSL